MMEKQGVMWIIPLQVLTEIMEMLICWNVFQAYASDLNYLVTDHWKYLIWVETRSAE